MTGETSLEVLTAVCHRAPMAVLLADAAGRLCWANERAWQWLEAEPVVGEPVESLLERGLRPVLGEAELYQGRDGRWLRHFTATLEDGRVAVYLLDAEGERQAAVDRHELLRALEAQQTRDPLTGLYNRSMLMQLLDGQISRSRRYGNPLSIMVLELGASTPEAGGDSDPEREVMAAGQVLREQLRWVDQVGRLGERTFLVILPETPEEAAEKLAGKLIRALSVLALGGGVRVRLTVCAGVSGWHRGDDLRRLLSRAEEALAQARARREPVGHL